MEDVRKLKPRERLAYWVREREAVRLARERGEPAPWTDDDVLRSYRFCNVRRADDRVTKWLLEKWYPGIAGPLLPACAALARFLNLPESLEIVRPLVHPSWDAGKIRDVLRRRKAKGLTVFNAAYMVRGNDGVDKIGSVVNRNVGPLVKDPPVVCTESMEKTWAALVPLYGFGSFMAGQVTADLRLVLPGAWADRLTWAPEGPGSRRGLNRFFGRDPRAPFAKGQFSEELRSVMDYLDRELPESITGRLEAMDFQSCLCEADKFERALWGQGRPKRTYAGWGRV